MHRTWQTGARGSRRRGTGAVFFRGPGAETSAEALRAAARVRSLLSGALVVVSTLVLSGCGDQRVAGGNTSETPNTVTGVLVDTLGKPRAGDTVVLRPARWTVDDHAPGDDRPSQVWTTVTDSSGRWQVSGMASGAWVVECRNGPLGRLGPAVTVGAERPFIAMRTDTVHRKGRVSGAFAVGFFPRGARGKVSVYGTDLRADVDSSGRFHLEQVPTGPMRLVAHLRTDSGESRAEDEFVLPPRDTLAPRVLAPTGFAEEDYDSWPSRKAGRLRFSGAGGFVLESTQETVPILVRLTGEAVQPTDPTGSSLRFADGGGSRLRYEIERWDPVRREADVWVLLRRAGKRSDSYGIVVYWGLPEAPDWSDGKAVFDTAHGWVGVWHFSGGDPLRDVTANGLRLAGTGWSVAPGIAGDGLRLDRGARLEVHAPQAVARGHAFVSAWTRVDSSGADGLVVRGLDAGNGNAAWTLRVGDSAGVRRAAFQTWAQRAFRFPAATTLPARFGTWTHLSGVLDANRSTPRLRLLVDTVMAVDQRFDTMGVASERMRLEVGGGWDGMVDEIRLRKGIRHPDVLRMEWGTGRPDAAVVWWGD